MKSIPRRVAEIATCTSSQDSRKAHLSGRTQFQPRRRCGSSICFRGIDLYLGPNRGHRSAMREVHGRLRYVWPDWLAFRLPDRKKTVAGMCQTDRLTEPVAGYRLMLP